MSKTTYSDSERQALVDWARSAGIPDEQILRLVITGIRGADTRRMRIVEWGKHLGLDASAALRKAHKAGLILTTHAPKNLQNKT